MDDKTRYVIDRVLDDIVVLENLSTKEIFNVNKELFPKRIRDGNVLIYRDGSYVIDKDAERLRRKYLLERFKNLRKEKDN